MQNAGARGDNPIHTPNDKIVMADRKIVTRPIIQTSTAMCMNLIPGGVILDRLHIRSGKREWHQERYFVHAVRRASISRGL